MTDHDTDPDRTLQARLARLMDTADALCADEEHRRDPLLQRAESHGVDRGTAERAYDLSVEEGLPPAYGIAVTAAGVSVQPLESARPDVMASDQTEPEWVDRPPPAGEADLERRMRQTFRRIRSFLAEAATPRHAFEALAREPDLEAFDY